MIYIYLLPVAKYSKYITDDEVLEEYFDNENNEDNVVIKRYTLDEFINEVNEENIYLDDYWIKKIDFDKDFYNVTSLHINDLKTIGVDTNNISEEDLKNIAMTTGSYLSEYFWECLHYSIKKLNIK